ncbi:TPA: hypothetical protein NI656_005497 [Pseudomonas aeruginosa]|uniref:hypothetical protein n=1 Tax=Pseudomonas aeruginosa TaxID=287 RepID=UPI00071BE38A|nr:hypothetical protein [Pseudomonas aeruginosa]KSP83335.1 hypothetical protein APB20_16020 [Pseudomonas aeruginosa]HCF9584619.1 hypothetical protein [Pseudomonas aeruginosa]
MQQNENFAKQAEQAEAERPEVVAVMESNGAGGKRLAQRFPIVNVFVGDELMTVAQHGRIVESRWNRAMDLMGEHVARISEKFKAERDAALAEVEADRDLVKIMQEQIDALRSSEEAASARVAELERTQNEICDLFMIGVNVRDHSTIMTNIRNTYRHSNMLHAIEAEFFMVSGEPSDEPEDEGLEPDEVCLLNCWGLSVDQYVEQFRGALAQVSQAQHSVPELDQLYSMLGAESQVDAAKKIAELVGCRLSRSALTEAQMRRLYDNSTEAENERLGFAAFARMIRRAEAVHQIAAAPGKEGNDD